MEFRKGDTVTIEGIEYEVVNEAGKYPNHIQVKFKKKKMKPFAQILKEKRDYYGNTEAAIEFAAHQYARQILNRAVDVSEDVVQEWTPAGEFIDRKHFQEAFDKIGLD